MSFGNLHAFVSELRRRGELVVVEAEVDPRLELAEIHRRVIAAGGPALLFQRVKGKSFPVVTNLFGSKARVDLAFGDRPKDIVRRIAALPEELLPPTAGKLWRERDLGLSLLKVGMRERHDAPVLQSRVPNADLTALPAITSWLEDGGPFITLPLVHTRYGDKRPDNLGMYRMQIHDANEAGMHFQIGKGGGFHLHEAEADGRPLPVNVYLGGPPALILSAIAPLPENVPELLLASLVLGKKLERGRFKDAQDLAAQLEAHPSPVAQAEFCLTGVVPPGVRRPEGPFGDHYGYYSLRHDYPVFRPHAIFHRPGAIYPATVVGKPRQEDVYIGDYLQELLIPILPKVMPGVRDLWSYGETGYHSLAGAVLRERYGREALSSVYRILGEGQLALTKFLLGVDQPIDLRDFRAVLTHVLERVEWETDLFVFAETAMDTLDYAGPQVNKGSKGVILGLGPRKRELPREFRGELSDARIRRVEVFGPGCLVVETAGFKEDRAVVEAIPTLAAFKDWPLLVVVDDARKAAGSVAAFLWTTFTRFDPASDIYAADAKLVRNKVVYKGPIAIDARMKPWYPDELFCDPETAGLVTRRWSDYFPDHKVEMGASDYGHLYG
jgi:UbiD family decarboxylase